MKKKIIIPKLIELSTPITRHSIHSMSNILSDNGFADNKKTL